MEKEVKKIKDLTDLFKEIYKNLPEKWEEMKEWEELKDILFFSKRKLNDFLDCIRPLIMRYGYKIKEINSFTFFDVEEEINEAEDLWETADSISRKVAVFDKNDKETVSQIYLFEKNDNEETDLNELVEDIENIDDINDYKSILQNNIARYFTLIGIPSEKSSYLDNEIIYEDEIITEEYDLRLKEETYNKIIQMGLVPVITFECDPDPMNTWLRVGLYGARPEYLATYIRIKKLSREEDSKLFWINKDLEGVIINPHIV